jgi:hypothetical protein
MIVKVVQVELGGETIESLGLRATAAPKDEAVWIDACGKTAECLLIRITLGSKGGALVIAEVE